jgi:signal peptidase I
MFQDLSTALLTDGYHVRFRAPGRSMSPTIRDGEAVVVAPVKASEVRRGDIVLYRCERKLIAHRVVCVEKGSSRVRSFILRGDASVTADAAVAAEQILGRVVLVERDGRMISLLGRRAHVRRMFRRSAAQVKGKLDGAGFIRSLAGLLLKKGKGRAVGPSRTDV